MKFCIPDRKGTVLGNAVVAKPVPYKTIQKLQESTANGAVSELAAMSEVVGQYVALGDGTPIDPQELPVDAIAALFTFATEVKKEAADFTSTPSA